MQWYILQVYSGNEKKIERELLAQIEKKNMQNNIEKILIPSEEVIEMKKGKKVNAERKFFPGYMLMKMKMDVVVNNQLKLEKKVLQHYMLNGAIKMMKKINWLLN